MKHFFAVLITFFILSAQVSIASEYRYRTYDVEDGLSNNKVNCILKDSKGLLWIGTPSGLNRFDGYDFKHYFSVKDDTTTLANNHIESIQEDPRGNMLIECGGTYVIYDRKRDRFKRGVASILKTYGVDITPSKIFIDKSNTVWIHDNYNGVFYIPNGSKKAYQVVDAKRLLTKFPVSHILQVDNTICFINKRGAIVAVNGKTHKIEWENESIQRTYPQFGLQNYSGFVDRQNRIWISSVDGLWVYNASLRKWDEKMTNAVKNLKIVSAITQDKAGNIWIGQDQYGLSILNTKTSTFLPLKSAEHLDNKTIVSLYADNDGNVWVGTYKTGLYQYNENMFKSNLYEFPDVNCIADAGQNVAWIGTDAGALIRWNRSTLESESYSVGNPVVSICADNDGSVWIGTYRGGLKHFVNGAMKTYGVTEGLATNNVWSVVSDEKGGLWIGTLGGGLQYFTPSTGKFVTYNTDNSALIDNFINTLSLTDEGKLYIGTTQGVAVMNVNTRTISHTLGKNDGTKSFYTPNIVQLYEDSRSLLWIATPDALYVYDKDTDYVQPIDLTMPFRSPYVLGLTEDKQGDIWASVGSNVIKIHVTADVQTGKLNTATSFYTQSDGLQSSDFNQRSLCRMSDGEILIGGLYGVNSFVPHLIKYDRRAPKVLFVDMRLFGQPVKVGEEYNGNVILDESITEAKKVNLSYSQNDFTIYFSTDSHVTPEKTVYYYRLVGFNSDWMQCAPDMHQVTYTNLTPGTYTLEVKAVNNDGTESKEIASLVIEIHPPFWLSAWAKACYVLLFILSIFYAIRIVKRREQRKYNEQKKAELSKQQEELAQMKFQFFTNISHELRTPLTLIISPLEAMIRESKNKEQSTRLQIMFKNASRLLYLVNQLLDFRKNEQVGLKFLPVEGDVVSFTKNLCDTFKGYSENQHVQLTFFSSHDRLHMLFDGDKYSKIILNLLSNAFKFTPDGGRVDVALSTDAENLVVKVADTGIGIDDAEKEHVFEGFYQTNTTKSSGSGIGLYLVKEYAKLHDGTVKIVDNVGGGSVFIVTIPIRHKTVESIAEISEQQEVVDASSRRVVLIVDDNTDLLTFLSGELSNYYTVETATNGLVALEMMEKHVPDIIISDIMMPEMDGIELCRRIKSNEKYSSIPLIMLSAKHDEQAKVEGLTIGADDYVTKPFNCDLLKLRIKKLLELSQKGVHRSHIEPEPSEIEVTSLDEKLIESAVKYVEKNMERPDLSVEELSRELGMSRVHLYKRMRQITGKTPTEFIRVIRLKRAAQLLRESQLNVSEIAYQVGYNNPKYFATYFKQEFGVLPSVYQTQQSKK